MKKFILGLCVLVMVGGVTPVLAGGGHGHHGHGHHVKKHRKHHRHHGWRVHGSHVTPLFSFRIGIGGHGHHRHRRHRTRPPHYQLHHHHTYRSHQVIIVDPHTGEHWHVSQGAPFCDEHWAYHIHHSGHHH